MIYQIKNLVKRYDEKTVLDIKDLTFEKGRIHGLLGPNGAGKTTLLEILAFLRLPTSGDVWFKDEKVDFNGQRLSGLRQNVVLVQQHPIMFSTSVFSNVEFPLKIRKMKKMERERAVMELLALVGMEGFREAGAHRLSGGETQRVAIARALACYPQVVFLDEPTAGVDVENQITIERIIKDINREKGITVILTTHDMVQASRLADEIVFMYEGKLAGSIYENIFSGTMERDSSGLQWCLIQNGFRLRVDSHRSGSVRVFINPEGVTLNRKNETLADRNNYFRGKLIQLTDEKKRVRALVDVGVPLSVLIPKEKFGDLQLSMGEEVQLYCLPESIEFF